MSIHEGQVDGFVWELTFAKRRRRDGVRRAHGRRVPPPLDAARPREPFYLAESVYQVVVRKSIAVQIRQLVLYMKDKLTDLWGG